MRFIRNIEILPRYLGFICVFLASALFSMQALAQDHGVGVGKSCPTATKVGDLATCTLRVSNEDEFGDSLNVTSFYDLVDPGGMNMRVPDAGNLPIIFVSDGVTCESGDGPIGLVFPCTIPGVAQPDGSGLIVRVQSQYTVPDGATDPLLDQGNITVQDACDIQAVGCNPNEQDQQFGAAVSLFVPSLEVTKTGPDIAKVGDEITYTIGFNDTSTGTGFPGYENCTGNDTVLGDLGEFVDGVTRDFNYTILPDDLDPLPNTVTITCDVIGFDNTVANSDNHSVDLIDPSIEVTKTGPALAKVGDTITYTIGFTNTGTGTLENCTGNDDVIGPLGAFNAGEPRNFDYTVQADDPSPLVNIATITCDVAGFDNQASDDDSHSVTLIAPSINVTKTGPDTAKVGDEITYTIGFTSTGTGPLGDCTGNDPLLGGDLGLFTAGETRDFNYTVQPGDTDPLVNTVTITCDVLGFDNNASNSDSHSVDLIDPSIEVTKTGPAIAKVGDTITYTIGFTNTGTGTLENCTGNDDVIGPLGSFTAGEPRNFDYTVQAGDADPLVNIATITCDVAGFDNQASDNDTHSVDLIDPSVNLTKQCTPDPVAPGDTINWAITVNNTGDIDLDCLVNDPTAGFTDEPVTVAAGSSETLNAGRTVEASDAPVISNTATVDCPISGFDNSVNDEATADCEVQIVNEICRTPGFWGTHAGTEKRRSTDLAQIVIDAAGGTIMVCGEEITNTLVPDNESSTEAICVSPKGNPRLQLARHLTAAALNCVVSGGGADCTGISIGADWAAANDVCINGGDYSYWGGIIDDWNNSEVCHERELSESAVFDGVSPLPGPAGSPNACNLATSNHVTIFTP